MTPALIEQALDFNSIDELIVVTADELRLLIDELWLAYELAELAATDTSKDQRDRAKAIGNLLHKLCEYRDGDQGDDAGGTSISPMSSQRRRE